MRSIVVLVLGGLTLIGCAAQAAPDTDQVSYTEMQLVDGGTLDGVSGSIILDSNDVVRKVNVDLFDRVNLVMGLEPTANGVTDWILTWTYEGELYAARVPGHVDVTVTDDCATLWVNADALSGSATFCAR
jgi:hypothetical protein